jgi:hypothetical protein
MEVSNSMAEQVSEIEYINQLMDDLDLQEGDTIRDLIRALEEEQEA